MLREIIQTFDWSALHAAAKDVRHPDAWVGRFKEAFPKAAAATPETCTWLLTQSWLLAICTGACLHELGESLYGLDAMKSAELDLIEAAHREVQVTQVGVLDGVFEDCLGDSSRREVLVRWHDEEVVPYLDQEWAFLASLEDTVATGSLDVGRTQRKIAELAAMRSAAASRAPA